MAYSVIYLSCLNVCVISSFLISGNQRSIPVRTYDSLVSYLENGAEVRYLFNISSCLQSSPPPFKDIPVFGDEIKYFSASINSGEDSGQLIFSNVDYINENEVNKEIHTFWIVNDTAKVFWAQPGVYINITDNISGIYCKWTEGQGSLWVKNQAKQRQLTSFPEIQTMLTSGEEVGWVVNITECQCAAGKGNCYHGILGDTIRGFKMAKDSSIHFSTSMTTIFPVAMNFIQLTTFVRLDVNNTATFITRHLDPSTFEQDDIDIISCPIDSGSSIGRGAKFYVN
ncbi:unnamed protein product [Mytilus edulis]|uniref:Uncharacterized protein n=1 Tax=Mytilus edulis TaxID=6550 RepID=A0A8S3UI35_MYTED|nr:unnamed protein product [Mytilus edulis]